MVTDLEEHLCNKMDSGFPPIMYPVLCQARVWKKPRASPRVVIAMGESREAAVLLTTAERRPRCAV